VSPPSARYAGRAPPSRGETAIGFVHALLVAQVLGILAADARWLAAPPALRLAAAAALLALATHDPRRSRALACAALAASAAFVHAIQLDETKRAPAKPVEVTLEGVVSACRPEPDRVELDLKGVRAIDPPEIALPGRLRLVAPREADAGGSRLVAALPGERLRVRARVRAVEGRANPGGRDHARALERRGIGAHATLVHPELAARIDTGALRPLAPLHRFRARAAIRLEREERGGALLAALALGHQDGLDRTAWDSFRTLGLAHLLSVSGLHLVLVAAGLHGAARRIAMRSPFVARVVDLRPAYLLVAVAGAAAYGLLAGWGVPVRRSLWMLSASALGVATRRPVRRTAPLAGAAVAILAIEPAALFDPGAQMSFAATAALVVVATRRAETQAGRSRLARSLAASLATSAAAGAATAPIAAASFGAVSPWGLMANLVAIPWTGWLLLPASLLAALAAGLAPEAVATRTLLNVAAPLAAASLDALAAVSTRLPATLAPPPAVWLLVLAGLAAVAIVATRRLALRVALAVVLPLALALAPPRSIDPAPPRVVVLDVGQGDAVLVQGRTGSLLVDAGTAVPEGSDLGATVVVPALRALGVERLDLLVASHGDLDHRGGLPAVVRALPVARVWLPYGGFADPGFASVLAAAHAAGADVEERGAGSPPTRAGDLCVEPLWPPPGEGEGSRNDRSLALRVTVAGRIVLLPGDLEAGAERRLLAAGAPLRADILKLGHHGSRSSSTAAWLEEVAGSVAVASAPRTGRFGMPHAEVVRRAHGAGYAVWWTGRDGAVLIGLEPVLRVRGWRR
jgi:competence protein ComEC